MIQMVPVFHSFVDSSKIVSLMPYYRPLKLSSKFSTRIKHACPNRVNVVYQFNCSEPRYIGPSKNVCVRIRALCKIDANDTDINPAAYANIIIMTTQCFPLIMISLLTILKFCILSLTK